jgi:hypothetical protein
MDGESSAAKAALETNEVEFALLTAGVHDPIVESRIRRLKEGVRSIIQGLPFPTSRPLLAWIVLCLCKITNLTPKRHGFRGGAVCARYQTQHPEGSTVRIWSIRTGYSTMENSMKLRTFSAITRMPTGGGNGSVTIMNLNTGKVCTRTPSQIKQLPMSQEWIEILVLWANVSGKLRTTETHCEYRGHELPEEDPTNMDADLTRFVNLYNEGVRMPAQWHELVVPEPTPIEDDVTVAWGNGRSEQIASSTLEDEVQELQKEREFVIPA